MTVPVPETLVFTDNADGVTTQFSYPVRFLEPNELIVIHESPDGSRKPLVYNVDYTVSGAGSRAGGVITLLSVPTQGKIIRTRGTAAKQLVDLEDSKRSPAEAIEEQLDRLAMVDQDVRRDVDRAVKVGFGKVPPTAEQIDKQLQDTREAATSAQSDRRGAEAARDIAAGYASDAVSQGNVPIYATVVGMAALEVPAGISAIRTNGYSSSGDGGAALYKRVASEPAHAGKVQSADGAWWELAERCPTPEMFGATTTGEQTDSFSRLEMYATGTTIDLGGKTYEVSTPFLKNNYINGYWRSAGITQSTLLFTESPRNPPAFAEFGGQLRDMISAINNPLEQVTGIVLIGDSITWGMTLPDNGARDPRSGNLSDPRDSFSSASWANELKRYIGKTFAGGSTPILSNWFTSPSGQALATFETEKRLYINSAPITITAANAVNNLPASGALLGWQMFINISAGATAEMKFMFTGTSFDFYYSSIAEVNMAEMEVYVNDVLRDTFSTVEVTSGYKYKHTVEFPYVKNGTVRIVAARGASNPSASFFLRAEGIVVNKQIRITNQGIIGIAARNYYNNALVPGPNGVAIRADDYYALVQLGTNDRTRSEGVPSGPNAFEASLETLIGQIEAFGVQPILMCANPVTNESPTVYDFHMPDVRAAIRRVAVGNDIDFIDNYAAFRGYDLTSCLADGLHPNRMGHAIIHRNIVGAIESA